MEKELYSVDDVLYFSPSKSTELYRKHLNPGFIKMLSLIGFDKVYKKAEGCVVTDMEGQQYLDFLGGYGAINIGHNHPKVIEALGKVQQYPNILQAGINPFAAALAANLAALTEGRLARSFFGNSGAEAVEGALKLARIASGKNRILYCKNSFHGKTFGALSVTGREKYRKHFEPLLTGCDEVEYGSPESLESKLKEGDAAAFILEPIQGEGGIIVPPQGYLKEVRKLCDHYEVLLIMDEIQTGFGRTGKMFAYMHENIEPDILCVAKSLGGGIMPVGAYMTRDEIYQRAYGKADRCLLHTSTFGGNTYACAAALAALEVICTEELAQKAAEKGIYLITKLEWLKSRYGGLREVRGKGLMIGLEFDKPYSKMLNLLTKGMVENLSSEYYASLVAGKLLERYNIITAYTLNNPNVIRIEPPLVVSMEQIDKLLEALEGIFSQSRGFIRMAAGSIKNLL